MNIPIKISNPSMHLLLQFPMAEWQEEPSDEWHDLIKSAALYEAPPAVMTLTNTERKWEVVSAYQKSVRRGNQETALKLVSAMCSLPDEMPYWLRRICTTACEDMGPANIELMNFVNASMHLFNKKVYRTQLYPLLCFLTAAMCSSQRSRVYCSYANLLQNKLAESEDLWPMTFRVLKANSYLMTDKSEKQKWAFQKAYNGGDMLHMQTWSLAMPMETRKRDLFFMKIGGLPSYTYDMYTMVGKRALALLSKEVDWQNLSPKAQGLTPGDKATVLGHALFYTESCLINDELYSPELRIEEEMAEARMLGVTMFDFNALQKVMWEQAGSAESRLNELRQYVFSKMGYTTKKAPVQSVASLPGGDKLEQIAKNVAAIDFGLGVEVNVASAEVDDGVLQIHLEATGEPGEKQMAVLLSMLHDMTSASYKVVESMEFVTEHLEEFAKWGYHLNNSPSMPLPLMGDNVEQQVTYMAKVFKKVETEKQKGLPFNLGTLQEYVEKYGQK